MKTLSLLEGPEFSESRPQAEPLLIDESGRVLRFALKPGQSIKRHCAPNAEVHIILLSGSGMFAGEDEQEKLVRSNEMLVFRPGEMHTVRALDEELVFVALLPSVDRQVWAARHPSPEADAFLTWHM